MPLSCVPSAGRFIASMARLVKDEIQPMACQMACCLADDHTTLAPCGSSS
jgi:hypothetical protein